jgi:glucan phosphoethanolaminetransferase (alkaline phosphatase superfamily)
MIREALGVVPRALRSLRPSPGALDSSSRAKAWLGRGLLLVPGLGVLGLDLSRRGERLAVMEPTELAFYALAALVGMVFWAALLSLATLRAGAGRWFARGALVALAVLAIGGQAYTFDLYRAYLNPRAVLVGTQMMPSVGQQLWNDRVSLLRSLLPPMFLACALVYACTRCAAGVAGRKGKAGRALDIGCAALLLLLFVSPEHGGEQGAPPDVLYVSSMGQLARARWDHNETVERVHPGPRSPLPVAHLAPKQPAGRPRNVVLIVTESVRAQSVCVTPRKEGEKCVYTPFSNAAAPDRIGLDQMRALDSTTAISVSVLWDGLLPTESRERLHTAPLLWEYAHAAGFEATYWTSQHMLFGNSGTWLEGLPVARRISATELDPFAEFETGADDGKLVDHVLAEIDELHEPFLAVVHLSNTHFPYRVDPDFAPFQPEAEASGPGYEKEIWNRYHDALYLQDRSVGRLIEGLHQKRTADRTVTLFVSDHGEQLREKGAVGHTGTLYDVEIRVPFWIDAPKGTLTPVERSNLVALSEEHAPVTELDVLPTMLDLIGVWDAPELAEHRAHIAGESLLRGGSSPDHIWPLTNCTELWACAFKNWGAIRGTKKLIANEGDHSWNCFDVAHDPDEVAPLPLSECEDLLATAERTGRPFQHF